MGLEKLPLADSQHLSSQKRSHGLLVVLNAETALGHNHEGRSLGKMPTTGPLLDCLKALRALFGFLLSGLFFALFEDATYTHLNATVVVDVQRCCQVWLVEKCPDEKQQP